jgi:IS5 family transposase
LKAKAAEAQTKEIKVSRTDAESGYMVRDGKPKGFFYLDHRTVDGKHAIITDTHVTPANVHDSVPYLNRLDRQRERFGFQVEAVGLDAGYSTAAIAGLGRTRHLWCDRLPHAQPRRRLVPQTTVPLRRRK